MLERVFQEPKFRVCCLGHFRLVEASSGTDMTPASRKARALIGYLCIVGRPVARERLASLLWGDRGDEQARASLRQAIYELRSMIAGNHLLKMERDTVAIGQDVSTDTAIIIATAQSGDLAQLVHALSEWHGEFFEDLPSIDESFDTWLQSERLRVQESLVNAAVAAATAGTARGEIDLARKVVNLLQQRDGTNEIVLRLGLRLDHRAGDTAAVHRRYERFCDLLKSELDAKPSAESQRLFQELASTPSVSADAIPCDLRSGDSDSVKQPAGEGSASGGTAHSEQISAMRSAKERALVPHQGTRSRHWIKFAGAAFAVTCLFALAWVNFGSLHKFALSPAGVATNSATGSPTMSAEHRLLGVDNYSEQDWARDATMESAARAAAQRALALNPNDGEALGVMAVLTPSTHQQEIDRLFERALRSEPNNTQLLDWHARFLMMVGRGHEALADLTRAYERDRSTPAVASNLALAFMLTGRFEEAREIIEQSRNKESPDETFALYMKYFLYSGNLFGLANYLRTLPESLLPSNAAFFRLCRETAIALATRGADKFGPLRANWRTETSVNPDDAVQFLFALGDDDGALEVVQSVVKSRRSRNLLTDPGWETLFSPNLILLRRDPRVAELFAQWGLSDYWRTTSHLPDFMR